MGPSSLQPSCNLKPETEEKSDETCQVQSHPKLWASWVSSWCQLGTTGEGNVQHGSGQLTHTEVLLTFSLTDPKERGIWEPARGGHPLLTPLWQGRGPGAQRELPGATREDFTSRPRRSRPGGPRPRHLLLMLRSMGLRLAACTRTTTSLGNWMAGRAISLLRRSTSLRP